MKKINFLFGVHCHQPIGNFDHIFEEAYNKAYLPFIKAIEKHPRIKISVHYSGELYDWFNANKPEYMDLLRKLVDRGQVEVMTGGYYEPIIPIIPDDDKLGQIRMESDFIQDNFKVKPRGMWLTERIWEPNLPKVLSEAGVEYVTVDDYHFISAGLSQDKLLGHYVTEEDGKCIKVFPINKMLRYLVPFQLPERTIEYLKSIASEDGRGAAILADDGEKFGVWPGTHKWVHEDGYLENFLNKLDENSSWIDFLTFSEYIDLYPPKGRIYLPTASYFEMMEWSLLKDAGIMMERIVDELKRQGRFEEYSRFFKGGFFRNFFVKYPESNNMHKKMLYVSGRVQELKKKKAAAKGKQKKGMLDKATKELYMGQCNCAYWHGIFGGLYLNYLRHAVYEHLIKSENEVDRIVHGKRRFIDLKVTDFDKDGMEEILVSNNDISLYISPSYGGSIFEIDYKPKAFNIVDTLARREESYHHKVKGAIASGSSKDVQSIHEGMKAKQKDLHKYLVYDWHRRLSLLDHFLAPDTDIDKFSSASYKELGDFTVEPFSNTVKKKKDEVTVILSREGKVNGSPVKVEKEISLSAGKSAINIDYRVTNLGKERASFWFGVEFNFSMLAGNAPDRYYNIHGTELQDKNIGSKGETSDVKSLEVIDDWSGFGVSLGMSAPSSVWRFPIETVSQSEEGFEKNYQSSVVFPNWKIDLSPGEAWSAKLVLAIEGR